MNDCIERKKAIELIQPHVKPQIVYGEGYLQAIEHATDILELMPAADVQPVKRGHWIKERRQCKGTFELYQTYIHCSECGKEHYYGTGDMPNFCDNCGADMRGDQND